MLESSFLALLAQVTPPPTALLQVSLDVLAIPLLAQLLLDSTAQLTDGVLLILDDVLLLDEEQVGLEDVEEQAQMYKGLSDAIVGQLGTSLQHLMNAVGVGLSRKGNTRGLVKRKQQLSRILHCSFFFIILEHRETMLVTRVS